MALRIVPLLFILFVLSPLFSFNSDNGNAVASAQGQASSVGSPGELGTCSRNGCHGAGSGGLTDNAGPGSVTLSSVPAMTNNQYVPGQLYHLTVTVAQSGVVHFGFACEILDNSGSTNTHVNNTAGAVTVTDATHTTIWQAFGTGRLSITQSSGGGMSSNTCNFIFDWTAPASGAVNVFLAGNATNNDAAADSPDNIYTYQPVLTPLITGIAEEDIEAFVATAFPIPTHDVLNLRCKIQEETMVTVGLYNMNGLFIRTLEDKMHPAGTFLESYAVNDLYKGAYFLKISCGSKNLTKTILIE